MRIIFLGTNGWYDTNTGNTICILIQTKKEYIILDAGNGLYKIDRYIKTKKPIYLFLSHFHLDHISGLHTLAKFNFPQGIDIYGPSGTKRILKKFINYPYTMPLRNLKTWIKLNEISADSMPITVKYKNLFHSTICLGYRFMLEGKTVTYCSDTGICKSLYTLAKDADLLITECSFKSGQTNRNWPHLNPELAAEVAKYAGVKKLVLIHFDPSIYRNFADRKKAENAAKKIFKNTTVAKDNMSVSLT